jgi:hypothetical protein
MIVRSKRLGGIAGHALDDRGVVGTLECVTEHCMDGGQAGVAGAHAVGSVGLQMVEERADQGHVEVGDVQIGGFLAGRGACEDQQEFDGVSIGGDRV